LRKPLLETAGVLRKGPGSSISDAIEPDPPGSSSGDLCFATLFEYMDVRHAMVVQEDREPEATGAGDRSQDNPSSLGFQPQANEDPTARNPSQGGVPAAHVSGGTGTVTPSHLDQCNIEGVEHHRQFGYVYQRHGTARRARSFGMARS
jgi:hypothetical protein